VTTTPQSISNTRRCSDSVGQPISDGAFDSDQWKGSIPFFSGSVVPNGNAAIRVQYNSYGPIPQSAIAGVSTIVAPSGWSLDLVAGTNPSRPVTNIPIWVQNIAQLPGMIKELGKLLSTPKLLLSPKGAASTYLGEQFGWAPLIDDLLKLLDLQKYVIKRTAELDRLASGQGIRRRLSFTDDTTEQTISQIGSIFGAGCQFTFKTSMNVKRRTWGTIHWHPTAAFVNHRHDLSNNLLALRLVLGITPEGLAKGIWDVIPWTWLIGWFTNLGKFTLANSWTVPATHGSGCFMSEAVATWSPVSISQTGGSGTLTMGGGLTRTRKTRLVSTSVTAGANIPFMDMWRLSILGSLFVQRFFR